MSQEPQVRKQPRRWLTVLLKLLVFAGFAGMPLGLVSSYLLLDSGPVDDADLLVHFDPVPPEQNGAVLLPSALQTSWWPDEKEDEEAEPAKDADSPAPTREEIANAMIEGSRWDANLAATILERNAAVLSAFAAIRARPAFDMYTLPNVLEGHPFDVYRFTGVIRIRALDRMMKGDAAGAVDDAIWLLRLSRRQLARLDALAEVHHAWHLAFVGLRLLERLLRERSLPEGALVQINQALEETSWTSDLCQGVTRCCYTWFAWSLDKARGEPDFFANIQASWRHWHEALPSWHVRQRRFLLPRATRTLVLASVRDAMVNATRLAIDAAVIESPLPLRTGLPGWLQLRNAPGEWIAERYVASYRDDEVVFSDAYLRALYGCTRTLVAVRRYELERCTLPTSLAELVPELLPGVPEDPYDGMPLRYSCERRVIYAVGSDFADDGGNVTGDADGASPADVGVSF